MTLEEFSAAEQKTERMDTVGDALEEVLSKARSQRTITVGVYEAAKLLNVDPDNVVLCLLAADEDDDRDVALQIHFTLIRAFCCENDINILRVSNPGRLAELLLLENDAGPAESGGAAQTPDLHCVLVTLLKQSLPTLMQGLQKLMSRGRVQLHEGSEMTLPREREASLRKEAERKQKSKSKGTKTTKNCAKENC